MTTSKTTVISSPQMASGSIKIAAIGDLLLTAKPGAIEKQRGLEALSQEIHELFNSCDLVLANLECTLSGHDKVAAEPRVFSSETQIRSLLNSGISLVSLGNNHIFDGKEDGYKKLTDLLKEMDIPFFGAGENLLEAQTPAVMNCKGMTIAVLAVVDNSTGMYRFATHDSSGVNLLDLEAVCGKISELKKRADHVIVTPHWGHERFRFPSPKQIDQARKFIDVGASLVVGHHPHVLQGMEYYKNVPVIYSLGNFLANNVFWENGDVLTWNRFERSSCILLCDLDGNGIHNTRQIPVYDDGTTIQIDRSGRTERYIYRANKLLNRGGSARHYRKESFRVRTLLPILAHLRWRDIKRIRPGHLGRLINLLRTRS